MINHGDHREHGEFFKAFLRELRVLCGEKKDREK